MSIIMQLEKVSRTNPEFDTNEKHFKMKLELRGDEENLRLIAVCLLSWG